MSKAAGDSARQFRGRCRSASSPYQSRSTERVSPIVIDQLSDATLSKLVREQEIQAVTHGFRSSFRDWCGKLGKLREVAEECLADVVSNKVEAAYARIDLLKRRRELVQAWAAYFGCGAGDAVRHGSVHHR